MRLISYPKRWLVLLSVLLCIAGCLADLVLIYIFGKQIPGYSQLTLSISAMGISTSPVYLQVTLWSVMLGSIFVFFGIVFGAVFRKNAQQANFASWLIIIYGLGEGIISGIFRADHINGELSAPGLIHMVLSGIGVIAVLILPWVMRKIFPLTLFPVFYHFSLIEWLVGITSILLFSMRIDYFDNTFINIYKGVWQRIFLIDNYIYFAFIAFMMIKKTNRKTPLPANNL